MPVNAHSALRRFYARMPFSPIRNERNFVDIRDAYVHTASAQQARVVLSDGSSCFFNAREQAPSLAKT